MTRRLLAIGECMVELSPAENGLFAVGFAGDTLNTAWYARQIAPADALKVTYYSAVGDDDLSARMRRFMSDAGLEPALRTIEGAAPGMYMIMLDKGERSFQYWRSASAARKLADDLADLPALQPGDLAYFSGITMAILPDDGRERLLTTLRDAAARGVTVVFDPNLRPRLWESLDEMRAWTTKSAGIADIVLPSHDDEATFFGDANTSETADRYLRAGARLVIVKNGPGEILARTSDGACETFQPTPAENVVDTTAAGDAFNAGFLVNYLDHGHLVDAMRAGSALSAHVIANRGALVPVNDPTLLHRPGTVPA